LLSSSLTVLHFFGNKEVERFTKEQEEALQLLTSLESITFWECHKLQCLPAGLHRLPNLKRLLHIDGCEAIRSLPKDGLPNSLQELGIYNCPAIRSIPKECLPNSLQKLEIRSCPAIRSLPKVNGLPSSLLQLDASYGNSEELRNQCRKLIGTIPIVRA
jgi:Leucine-rich repeat (LRR) protein